MSRSERKFHVEEKCLREGSSLLSPKTSSMRSKGCRHERSKWALRTGHESLCLDGSEIISARMRGRRVLALAFRCSVLVLTADRRHKGFVPGCCCHCRLPFQGISRSANEGIGIQLSLCDATLAPAAWANHGRGAPSPRNTRSHTIAPSETTNMRGVFPSIFCFPLLSKSTKATTVRATHSPGIVM